MNHDVHAKLTADVIFEVPDAQTPEEAIAKATGPDSDAREQFRNELVAAVQDAIQAVFQKYGAPCKNPRATFVTRTVAWGGDDVEYAHDADYVGDCVECGAVILDRTIPGQPYTYGYRDENYYEMCCYSCLEKQKAAETP